MSYTDNEIKNDFLQNENRIEQKLLLKNRIQIRTKIIFITRIKENEHYVLKNRIKIETKIIFRTKTSLPYCKVCLFFT